MKNAKWVKSIMVLDPDGGVIEMVIYKHENGGMFGMDASFIEQMAPSLSDLDDESDDDITCAIMDPFAPLGTPEVLFLEEN